jgi:hypothetical protein
MALSITSTTVQPAEVVPATQPALTNSDAALLLVGALAGVSMTKTARRQYRKMARKATWKMLGYKMKAALGIKNNGEVPDTILGINFWLFLGLLVVGVAVGTWLFGLAGFLILVGIAVIILLLVKDDL